MMPPSLPPPHSSPVADVPLPWSFCLVCFAHAQPTFILYKNKEKVSTIMGANTKALQDAVEEHSG